MSKFKIVNLFDKLFISVSIFLIIYAWINFYIRDLWLTFFVSLIFSFALTFVIFYLTNKKQKFNSNKKIKQQEIDENFYFFKLTPKSEKLNLLKSCLEHDYSTALKNEVLTYTKNNKKVLVILATHHDQITQNLLINIVDEFNNIKVDTIEIICCSYDFNINTNLFKDKNIILTNKENLYSNYFSRYNTFPNKTNINEKTHSIKWKDILIGFFNPKKSKSYFFCGFVLIFSSIILPFNFYYIAIGSMLLLFSIICKILPNYTKNLF